MALDVLALAVYRLYVTRGDLLLEYRIRHRHGGLCARRQHPHDEIVDREYGDENPPCLTRRHLRLPRRAGRLRIARRKLPTAACSLAFLHALARPLKQMCGDANPMKRGTFALPPAIGGPDAITSRRAPPGGKVSFRGTKFHAIISQHR